MNVRPILHWYRQFDAGVFWRPANDCDCLGGFAKLPAMDSWNEHSWRLQPKATLQLEFFFPDFFFLDFLDSDENSRTS